MSNLLSNKSYEELELASQEWSKAHKRAIVLDEGRKATYSKCFLKHKLDSKTVRISINGTRYSAIIKMLFNTILVFAYLEMLFSLKYELTLLRSSL